ncbi:MAG: hypothetical protein AB8F95_03475 [Bacteroidia bacterium]
MKLTRPYISLFLLVIMTLALTTKVQAGEPAPSPAHLFHSYSSDVSDISLRLQKDGTFTLEMYLVAFEDYVIMKGSWTDKGDRWELTFTQNRPTLDNLIDEDMILGTHTFKIEKSQPEFYIYGTLCAKSSGQPSLAHGK